MFGGGGFLIGTDRQNTSFINLDLILSSLFKKHIVEVLSFVGKLIRNHRLCKKLVTIIVTLISIVMYTPN